ncbi:MAG: glycosyltransferase family 39 protein [Candidatus Omnitrophica bacterium]|nr:glycosyltransferase family 39 protein [Candidatus Omnitrophota bacterium]MCM8808902.1 glycosyltransferase family 39 protein [Candidatus Omnitrophota bacterium]MCM8811008.1 glycosyltransferase family 39 protein [Candidatus Omnitrophota bacterium]
MLKKIIIIISSFLFISTGIKWGLPKDEYKEFFYRNEQEMKLLIEGINKNYIEKSWQISKTKFLTKLERHRFNIIRSFHPDEENILKSISNMKPEKFDFNPHFFEYPSFYIYTIAAVLKILSFLKLIYITSDISFYFENPDQIAKFYLFGRLITLIFAVLTIFLLCEISEKIKKGSYLITFFLILFSPLFFINSTYMTVDIPMLFWSILSIFFLIVYFENLKEKFLFLSSMSIGFATGTKYPAIIFWFLIPIILLLKNLSMKEFLKKSIISFFITIISFFITTPYSIFSFNEFKKDFLYQYTTRGTPNFLFFTSNLKNIIEDLILINGKFITIFFASIFVFSLFKLKKQIFIIYIGLFLYFLLLLTTSGFKYARYYLPLYPFIILISSHTIKEIEKIRKLKFLIYFVFISVISLNLLKTVSIIQLRLSEDTRIISAHYIDKNLKEKTKIVFLKSPWIFEVCPVNFFKYNITIVEKEEELTNIPDNSYLVIGELQYFLTKNSRNKIENEIIKKMESYGFSLIKKFEKEPFLFKQDKIIHDMLYVCPKIFLFYKNEQNV